MGDIEGDENQDNTVKVLHREIETNVAPLLAEIEALRAIIESRLAVTKIIADEDKTVINKAKSLFYHDYKRHPLIIDKLARQKTKMIECTKVIDGKPTPYMIYNWRDVKKATDDELIANADLLEEYTLKAKSVI
jgi:hypothetical protein